MTASTSARPRVLFVTSTDNPQLTVDDRLLADAVRARGIEVQPAIWHDDAVSWDDAQLIVVRSTWDYFLHYENFVEWVRRVGARGRLQNPASTILWNSHKSYLGRLARRGIPVIDTVFVTRDAPIDVAATARTHGWREVVVKPAVSAAAHETRDFGASEYVHAQAHLARVLERSDAMLQPYLTELGERGELSLLFVSGRFSHAVRRRSALADPDHMPRVAATEAPREAVQLAERVLATAADELATSVPPLYARVDLAEGAGDDWQLLELELIEPTLFFATSPLAAGLYADAISRMI